MATIAENLDRIEDGKTKLRDKLRTLTGQPNLLDGVKLSKYARVIDNLPSYSALIPPELLRTDTHEEFHLIAPIRNFKKGDILNAYFMGLDESKCMYVFSYENGTLIQVGKATTYPDPDNLYTSLINNYGDITDGFVAVNMVQPLSHYFVIYSDENPDVWGDWVCLSLLAGDSTRYFSQQMAERHPNKMVLYRR